jgi:NDP-sugar pyrophosphorylase family protein
MQCVILAAGRGTRMGALCDDCPKPMLPINGKPKLAYSIETLPQEITEVVLIVGYLKECIMDFFGDSYAGRAIQYVVHETIDGTGKVLHSAKDILNNRFLVTMGDDLYCRDDLEKLMEYDVAVLALEVGDSSQFGALKTDANGKLEAILERPHDAKYRLVNTGAYMLTKDFFRYPLVKISETEYGLPQTMMQMKKNDEIMVISARDWFPIGDPQALKEAQTKIRDFVKN